MDPTSTKAIRMKRGRLLFAAAILLLAGCHGALLTYKGSRIPEPYRISLPNGVQEGRHYESPDLNIDYRVIRQGDQLEFSGTAEYTPRIIHAYTWIEFFSLSVLLTDQQGVVLEQRGISTPGSDTPKTRMRFSETMKIPPQTANMTFVYSGTGIEQDYGDDGGSSAFWQILVVR